MMPSINSLKYRVIDLLCSLTSTELNDLSSNSNHVSKWMRLKFTINYIMELVGVRKIAMAKLRFMFIYE
jgi:hypothetical protein